MIPYEWITQSFCRQLAISHVGWYLTCTVCRTRRLRHCANLPDEYFTRTHTNTQLMGLRKLICLEHICQCSIKNPSDKRFKWLPLWVMSCCISEEAFTAQQMKIDEKDRPLRLSSIYALVALMQMHVQKRCIHYFYTCHIYYSSNFKVLHLRT